MPCWKCLFDKKILVGLTLALALSGFGAGLALGEDKELNKPEIIVAFFYADWDPVCLRVDLAMERLGNKYDGRPVLGIVLDVSNQTNRHHSELLASALGLEAAWNANGEKVGIGYIVDAQTHAVLDTLIESDDLTSGAKKIDEALEKASK